jgi:hypothetical protein
MVGKRTIIPCSDPDPFLYTNMRDCGYCGVGQNGQKFDGDIDDSCTNEGYDY